MWGWTTARSQPGSPKAQSLPDYQNPPVRWMDPLDAPRGQQRVVLQRDAQLPAAPLGQRHPGEELEGEQVVLLERPRALPRLPVGHRRPDAVTAVAHRVRPDGDVDGLLRAGPVE